MFELKDFSAFKHHLRDFLVQTKQFASQDNADLFAEEVAQQREVCGVEKCVSVLLVYTNNGGMGMVGDGCVVVVVCAWLVVNWWLCVRCINNTRSSQTQAERQRLSAIPGMLHPNELQEEMVDA